MFPFAPIISVIIFVVTFDIYSVSIVRYLYFIIFLASFLITFLSPEIATSIDICLPFSVSHIMMSCLFIVMGGSVGLLLLIP